MSTGNDFGGHAKPLCGNDAQRRHPANLVCDPSRRSTVMRPGQQVARGYKSDTASISPCSSILPVHRTIPRPLPHSQLPPPPGSLPGAEATQGEETRSRAGTGG